MINVTIPTRPFSTEIITGMMLPDGIFEAALGTQKLNAQFHSSSSENGLSFYLESVSHPGIQVTPATHSCDLSAGAVRVLTWDVNVSQAPAGDHFISFVVARGAEINRLIKKIFVTRVTFDPFTTTFGAETPEGTMAVRFRDFVRPTKTGCCGKPTDLSKSTRGRGKSRDVMTDLTKFFRGRRTDFEFCPPGYLPTEVELVITPTPPFAGQYGDLPFQDPWWKVVLCIVAVILLLAASIVAAESGDEIIVTQEGGGGGGEEECCGVGAEGGSSSYVAAGLVAAAAACATAACMSDARDPIRRGQDNTVPMAGEITVAEKLRAVYNYVDPVALGRRFKIGTKWQYTRVTTGNSYDYEVDEINENQHVLKEYEIKAAELVRVYRRETWIVEARFIGENGKPFRGGDLFAQCFLAGPHGESRSFILQDDGVSVDQKPADGVYTGSYQFALEANPRGLWEYFVIAQDVNSANENLTPEEAAKIIGGFVLTHQLTITFDPTSPCPFVADGHVSVV